MLTSPRHTRSADGDPPCARARLAALFGPARARSGHLTASTVPGGIAVGRRAGPPGGVPDPPGVLSGARSEGPPDGPPADLAGAPDADGGVGGHGPAGPAGAPLEPAGKGVAVAPARGVRAVDGVGVAGTTLAGRFTGFVGRFTGFVGRIDPGRRGLLAVLAVALVVAGGVGWATWRARPVAEPVPPPVRRVIRPVRPSATPTGTMVVAVAGRVRRPGVVTLPRGSRVVDAIRAAGGLAPGSDPGLLNLARRLADGDQVVVGVPGVAGRGAPVGSAGPAGVRSGGMPGGVSGERVNLNAATAAELVALPGIGPVTAQRIVDWRRAHGPFTSVDQLRQVSGIGPAKFARIRDLVTV